jgi:hypothetical protein
MRPTAAAANSINVRSAVRAFAVRRRSQSGQSAIIAVIVLFLLLFLGAAFIALIANNLRNTKRAATSSASGRYAEAGIRYLDQQLLNSPQGADWRPNPDCPPPAAVCAAILLQDPDYFYLQPYRYDTGLKTYVGGFTRVNFGGPQPGAMNTGGRALVRITYRPDIYDGNGNLYLPGGAAPDPNYPADPTHKYIKLEAVGRSGQVDPNDPTTFGNSNGYGERVELSAYKQIGLNEYVRQITNKDDKPDSFPLGATTPVQDYDNSGALISRNIETLIDGPVRVNGNVTFFGTNRLRLNQNRNDALEVSGKISLNGVTPTTTGLSAADPTRVFVNVGAMSNVGNLFPSDSPNFTTGNGIVRDNPRGSETLQIQNNVDAANSNLRAVAHTSPPLIDAPIGPNGLTRYLALTRDSAPLPASQMTDNPLDPTITSSAGADGWGTGLYINNAADNQAAGLFSSPRSEWLNPAGSAYWNQGDSEYSPPAVDIVLTPRYMIVTGTGTSGSYFRSPSATFKVKSGATPITYTAIPGQRLPQFRIVRYSGGTAPTDPIIPDGTPMFEGYAVAPVAGQNNTFSGDDVIYAEGNVRIRGVVGGIDRETANRFIRHLTVVSNGTIYVDGNLLRDNFPSGDAGHSQSSIALLAKNYITVNTTQFLSPDNGQFQSEQGNGTPPFSLTLNANLNGTSIFNFHPDLGPQDRNNTLPGYVTTPSQMLFFRHAAERKEKAGVKIAINTVPGTAPYFFTFPAGYAYAPDPTTLLLQSPNDAPAGYNDDVFPLAAADVAKLLKDSGGANPATGSDNLFQIEYQADPAVSTGDYLLTRVGVAPLDIRIEALMYAQEGSFFIVPGPWFNPDPKDNVVNYAGAGPDPSVKGVRSGDESNPQNGANASRINDYYPFYRQPMDIRITFFGAISENTPAEIGDQNAWLEKWGWAPNFFGSSGFPTSKLPVRKTSHGPYGTLQYPADENPALTGAVNDGMSGGSGIVYQFDDHAISPYYDAGGGAYQPIRVDQNGNVLPLVPNLPVAPGLLYFGQDTTTPQ